MHWSDLEVAASARVVHSGLQGRTRPVGEAQAFVAVRHPAAAPAQRSSSAQAQLPPGHAVGTGTGLPRPCRTPMKRRHSAHCRGPRGGGCRQRNAEHVCTRNHRQGLEAALCSHITGEGELLSRVRALVNRWVLRGNFRTGDRGEDLLPLSRSLPALPLSSLSHSRSEVAARLRGPGGSMIPFSKGFMGSETFFRCWGSAFPRSSPPVCPVCCPPGRAAAAAAAERR